MNAHLKRTCPACQLESPLYEPHCDFFPGSSQLWTTIGAFLVASHFSNEVLGLSAVIIGLKIGSGALEMCLLLESRERVTLCDFRPSK